jgi:hypothetical protein
MNDDTPSTRSPLEVLAAAAALTAALLPAAGVSMRWMGFALGGIWPSFDSAVAVSGTQLALSGFAAVASWPIVIGLGIQVGFLWLFGLLQQQAPTWEDFKRLRQSKPSVFWGYNVIIPLTGLISSASTGAKGIGFAIAFGGTYVAGFVARWALSDRGRVTLAGAILAVVIASGFAATGAAVAGNIPGLTPVEVRFVPTSGLQDGSYVVIGHDGTVYLWSCTRSELEEINYNFVINIVPTTVSRGPQPAGFSLGVHPACP